MRPASRPLGLIFNCSPSASLTGGYGAEVPEPIDYFNNTVKVMSRICPEKMGNTNRVYGVVLSERYRCADSSTIRSAPPIASRPTVARPQHKVRRQAGSISIPTTMPTTSTFAGSFLLMKHLRLLASINAGWLRQNDPFVPYTTNSILLAGTGPLPASSLHGEKQTLAMNYKLIQGLGKKFEIKAGYRQYDYNNNTPVLSFTPVQGDIAAANLDQPGGKHPVWIQQEKYRSDRQLVLRQEELGESRLRRRDHGPFATRRRAFHRKWICGRDRLGAPQGSFVPRVLPLFSSQSGTLPG